MTSFTTKKAPAGPNEPGGDKRRESPCFSCKLFYITHDPAYPYGCRAGGFKSRLMPSQEMYANSGIECQLFTSKERMDT